MQTSSHVKTGSILIEIEGILLIISNFIRWTNSYSPYQLYKIALPYDFGFYYLFPLISGCLLMMVGLVNFAIQIRTRMKQLILLFGIIIALNLELYFLTEIINLHGTYLWQNLGLYLNIFGLGGIILTISICFFTPPMQNEDETQKIPSSEENNNRNLENPELPSNSITPEDKDIDRKSSFEPDSNSIDEITLESSKEKESKPQTSNEIISKPSTED